MRQRFRYAFVQFQFEYVERVARFYGDVGAAAPSRYFRLYAQDALAHGADQVQGDLIVAFRLQFLIRDPVQNPVEGGQRAGAIAFLQGRRHSLHERPFGIVLIDDPPEMRVEHALGQRGLDFLIGKIQPDCFVCCPRQRQKPRLIQQGIQRGTVQVERCPNPARVEVDVAQGMPLGLHVLEQELGLAQVQPRTRQGRGLDFAGVCGLRQMTEGGQIRNRIVDGVAGDGEPVAVVMTTQTRAQARRRPLAVGRRLSEMRL